MKINMLNVHHAFRSAPEELLERLNHLYEEVFQGSEGSHLGLILLYMFGQREVTRDMVYAAFPQRLDALPFQGVERQIAEAIIDALRERGYSDEQITKSIMPLADILELIFAVDDSVKRSVTVGMIKRASREAKEDPPITDGNVC